MTVKIVDSLSDNPSDNLTTVAGTHTKAVVFKTDSEGKLHMSECSIAWGRVHFNDYFVAVNDGNTGAGTP